MTDRIPRDTLAMQAVALLTGALAIAFFAVVVIAVVPNFSAAFKTEPVRIGLFPIWLAAAIAAALLAWRWRATGATWTRWLVLAIPALAFVALYAYPLSRDFVRPTSLPIFLAGGVALLSAVLAIVASIVAAVEAGSGAARLSGLALTTPRGVAPAVAALVIVLLAFSGLYILLTPHTGGGAQLGVQSQLTGHSNNPPPPGPNAANQSINHVAEGVIPRLPDGTLYASVASDSLAPGATNDFKSPGGVLYAMSGLLAVTQTAGATNQTLAAGQALFLPPDAQVHEAGSGGGSATWYLLSFRPTSGKTSGNHEVCQSQDLPPLPNVNQAETLFAATVKAGGRGAATRTGGVEVVVGLSGTVEVHAGTLPQPKKLAQGQCVTILEGTPIQVFNAAGSDSQYLAFYLSPSGATSSPVSFGL